MATPVAPQPIDADNFAGSSPTRRTVCCNDWHRVGRFHVGTSYNSRSSLQMPDIRLQALPFAINSEFVLTLGGSPYKNVLERAMSCLADACDCLLVRWEGRIHRSSTVWFPRDRLAGAPQPDDIEVKWRSYCARRASHLLPGPGF